MRDGEYKDETFKELTGKPLEELDEEWRATLKRCRPRLAISSYHLKDDPANIARIVWSSRADYLIGSKDVVNSTSGIVPKVLFFY